MRLSPLLSSLHAALELEANIFLKFSFCVGQLLQETLTVHILHPSKLPEDWKNTLLRALSDYHSSYKHIFIFT